MKATVKIGLVIHIIAIMVLQAFLVTDSVYAAEVLDGIKAVSLGMSRSAAIKEDGSLWMWGDGTDWRWDDPDTRTAVPVKIMDGVRAFSVGDKAGPHMAVIKEDGSLWMWGSNSRGQLGVGTTQGKTTPIKIMDGVKAVSLGTEHSAAIKEDGSLWTWGFNSTGQLGDGTTEDKDTPVKIMDEVKAVSLNGSSSAAIKEDGSLWLWGYNATGQPGDGTVGYEASPVKIMDKVKAVAEPGGCFAAIKEDGSLWTWGNNPYGELGDGTTEDKDTPVKIMEDVKEVSFGSYHAAAVKEDGSLWTWGFNGDEGRLGDGTTEPKLSPVKIMDGVKTVSLGGYHSAAIKEDGSLWTWGDNYFGQLGDGTLEHKTIPTRVFIYDWGEPAYFWSDDNSTVTAIRECKDNPDQTETETVPTTITKKDPTCIEAGCATWISDAFKNEAFEVQSKSEEIPALGHDMAEHTEEAANCESAGNRAYWKCERCGKYFADEQGKTEIEENSWVIEALGHDWAEWIVIKEATSTEVGLKRRSCKNNPTHVQEKTIPKIVNDGVTRFFGSTRYETSLIIADELKDMFGTKKIDALILADGRNYPDALAGSYLSAAREAPILLVDNKQDHISKVQAYIKANLKEGGTIYMLGGTAVVPAAIVKDLKGYEIIRLWGNNRYETNLAILNEAGKYVNDNDIIVCTGTGFADSLSAAALGKPILLVQKALQKNQKQFLASLSGENKIYIIGGTGVVSEKLNKELSAYGTTIRIGGKTRYETSVNVAKEFFDSPQAGVLAYGQSFPDGLCGGALAYAMKGPLILSSNANTKIAEGYAREDGMRYGAILGGPTLISDSSAKRIFGCTSIYDR